MLFTVVYLLLFGLFVGVGLLARRGLPVGEGAKASRNGRGLTPVKPGRSLPDTPRTYTAKASLAGHRAWSWGVEPGRIAYGVPALTAVFVLLDLSRLAVDGVASQPLGLEHLGDAWFAEGPPAFDKAGFASTAGLLMDHLPAWDVLPLQPLHSDAGWFI